MNLDNINFEQLFYDTLKIGWSFVIGFLFALYMVNAEQYNEDRRTLNQIENTLLNWDSEILNKDDIQLIIRGY